MLLDLARNGRFAIFGNMLSRSGMSWRSIIVAAVGLVALAATSNAQSYEATHGSGGMAMSAEGRFIAFTVVGQPANCFVLFNTEERTATTIETPGPHVGDLGWSPDGDELTFVTAGRHTLGGGGGHVWRMRLSAEGPRIELLALIPLVRSPVLSADGTRLAAFEGVVAGDGPPTMLNTAHAVFERTLSDGRATRRSEGHAELGGDLMYDRAGALFVRLTRPVFPHASRFSGGVLYSWRGRDADGRWETQWRAETGGVEYFRLLPGETLAAWPLPFQIIGAPPHASLVRPLDDGRIALYVRDSPSSVLDWYDERGQARPRPRAGPPPWNYVAFSDNGASEILVRTPLPEGAGRTGGADLSSNGVVFAQVVSQVRESPESHTLMVFERGVISYEAPISDIVSHGRRIVVEPSDIPLVVTDSEPHRITVAASP